MSGTSKSEPMKKILVAFATVIGMSLTGFSQNLSYEVRGIYHLPIKKEKLSEAQTISDMNAGYPKTWITDYISAEIRTVCDGKVRKAVSTNDRLSNEQKSLLTRADLGTDIIVEVKYKYKNAVTEHIDSSSVHFSVTVVPEVEAEYAGGELAMKKYLEEKAINKIAATNPKQFRQGIVRFTVNEQGKITHAKIARSSGEPIIDQLLLKVITKMPKWIPARNAQGVNVKQEFEWIVGNDGC